MLQEFKELVALAPNNILAFERQYNKIAEYLDIDIRLGYDAAMVKDKLSTKITELLFPIETNEPTLSCQALMDLKDGLVYESVLSSVDNSSYLTLLEILTRHNLPVKSFDKETSWIQAIGYAKDYESFSPNTYTVQQTALRETFPKQYDFAAAALDLKEMGCEVVLNGVILEINKGVETVAQSIEDIIKDIGGVTLMKTLFAHLVNEKKYFDSYKRYVFGQEITLVPHETRPMVPVGYLLNLAVKYPYENPYYLTRPSLHQTKQNEIGHKSTLLATVLDIRHYGTLDMLFHSGSSLSDYIRRLALFDTAHSFPSNNIDYVIDFMSNLFLWVDGIQFTNRFGFSIADLIEVTKAIHKNVPDIGPQYVYLSKVKKWLPDLDNERLIAMFSHLAHAHGTANEAFKFISDYEQVNFGFKPLLLISPTKFLLCDKSWCATGFYEVLATLVREMDTKEGASNNQIGKMLEKYVYKKLSERGIAFIHGRYEDGTKPDGEVDVLIESPKNISLVEIKKKTLTRKGKTGSDVQLIIDLAESLLDAQVQTGRSELLLRHHGFINLLDDRGSVRVNWNNRELDRIALTQWDFGSFQDRTVINNILAILVNSEVVLKDLADPEIVATFQRISAKRKKWEKQAADLKLLDKNFDDFPFFNCWFLSLPQLLIILQCSNNNDEFYEMLYKTKHISFGTVNFYLEFYLAHLMR